jgi:hypothetical protein
MFINAAELMSFLTGADSVRALITPNPRVIASDVWAKLLWAGLNLEQADLVTPRNILPFKKSFFSH